MQLVSVTDDFAALPSFRVLEEVTALRLEVENELR